MRKKYVLFDLDGTITDSCEGITKSVQYALEKMGIEETNPANLNRFIGPPLDESFMGFYGMSKEDALKAVSYYRERYAVKGIYENEVFPGIEDMLKQLKEYGFIIALATCKPEIYVPSILNYFDLAQYFTFAVGSELEGGKRRHKDEVIDEVVNQIIEKYNLSGADYSTVKNNCILIGDRKDDVNGAKKAGIDSMGVKYGFAEPGELEEAGPTLMVDSVEDIVKTLLISGKCS